MELARTLVAMVLGIVLPLGLQLADRRRLPRDARDRGWNVASWAVALYAFGPLSLLGWFWVTRLGGRKALGLAATAAVVAAITGVDLLLERWLG